MTGAVLGRRSGLRATWAEGRPRLGALYGVQLVLTVLGLVPTLVGALAALPLWRAGGVAAGAGLLLAAVVYAVQICLGTLLSLADPAAVAEGLDARNALWRSVELVRGAWWRCFGVQLLVGLVAALALTVVMIPVVVLLVALVLTGGPVVAIVVGGVVYLGLLAALLPMVLAGVALLHHDQRMRRGGTPATLPEPPA